MPSLTPTRRLTDPRVQPRARAVAAVATRARAVPRVAEGEAREARADLKAVAVQLVRVGRMATAGRHHTRAG